MAALPLRVAPNGLRVQAGWCEGLAGKMAGNGAPAAGGSSWLASTVTANAVNGEVAAANIRCAVRVQATATKLAAAATSYAEQEAHSAARLRAIDVPKVR